MNSVKVGDSFEEKIYNLFRREIEEDRFYLKASCCKIFRKKGYYSASRKSNIIFDISIEVYLPGSKSYSLLLLIECKKYNHSIPVDDLEEFWSKTEQVGEANTKAMFATNAALQSGAFTFAESKGIAYLRYLGDAEHKWELYRSASASAHSPSAEASETAMTGLIDQDFQSQIFDLYMISPARLTNSLWDFISDVIDDLGIEPKKIKALSNISGRQLGHFPFIEKEDLEALSQETLNQIDYAHGVVRLDDICSLEKERSGLKVLLNQEPPHDTKAHHCGSISFDNLEIKIFNHSNPARERFTLAHELAHYLLKHGNILRREFCVESDFTLQRSDLSNGTGISRLEFQANYFASCLLMPRSIFLSDFRKLTKALGLPNRGHGALFVDNQRCNVTNYEIITNQLMKQYGVSRSATAIRLSTLGLLKDVRDKPVFNVYGLQPLGIS